ncbi:MAG: hypothetical protein A4E53_01896 [Pelotomaculum sp. PtaB.Bin104]|nr:MAG: hypothetical protein A4E53_01896 [Pelotomaculum sp. PtaB.Bin104]
MDLEEKKVKRSDLLKNPRNKEWWYIGCFDESQNLYFSFSLIRSPFIDKFTFTVFDIRYPKPFIYGKKMYLESDQKKQQLDLSKNTRGLHINYFGTGEKGWFFNLKGKDISVSLEITPTQPYFTKFDNQFINQYSLLYFMQNKVRGEMTIHGHLYKIDSALGYYDHCFGRVPRRTSWHWLAVQNKDIAFVSLINYGPYPQLYTQVLVKTAQGKSEWVRLSQQVSFEYTPESKNTRWLLTSCDADLSVDVLMIAKTREKIPPLLPVIINLQHDEYFVRVKGRVKVDHGWINVGVMHGVLEEHYGKW